MIPKPSRVGPALCLGLAAAVLLAFWPVTGNGFLSYDDDRFIHQNPRVLAGLTLDGVRWALTSTEQLNWHPLTWLIYMLDWGLFGPRAGLHHLMSVLWHALAAALLFLALRRLTGRAALSAFAAALFALHPLRVESVAWATEIKDPLAGCLFGLALLAYSSYALRPTLPRYAAVAAAFGLGLMAKPTLVPLPFLLLLLDVWPLGRRGARVVAEKIPLLLLAGAASLATYRANLQGGTAGLSFAALSLPDRLANAAVSLASYLGQTFLPVNLAVFYPHPGSTIPAAKAAAASALLLALVAGALLQWRRRPYLAAGLFWFFGMIFPVSGLVQAGIQARADRFTYLPFAGLALALAWGAGDLAAGLRVPRPARAAAAGAALAALAAVTWATARHWRDDETLFGHALAVTERNHLALFKLGTVRVQQGRSEEAISLFRRSIAIRPGYNLAHYYLGNAYREQGRLREAIASYRDAISVSAGAPAEVYNNLGAALAQTGDLAEAERLLQTAVALRPGYAEAANNLRFVRQARLRR